MTRIISEEGGFYLAPRRERCKKFWTESEIPFALVVASVGFVIGAIILTVGFMVTW